MQQKKPVPLLYKKWPAALDDELQLILFNLIIFYMKSMIKVLFFLALGLAYGQATAQTTVPSKHIFLEQSPQKLQGSWVLDSAQLNQQADGACTPVKKLSEAELESKAIPLTLEFANDQLGVTVQKMNEQSSFSFKEARLSFGAAAKQKTYTSWLESENALVLINDYSGADYPNANEIRLTYKKK
jgi:hypothetical protein